jgi:putative ABC transport system permease protein
MRVYFTIAFRHLWNNKLFSMINIVGLALGLACCYIILLHVRFETGYDRIQINKDRIVRVLHDNYSYTPIVMATVLPEYFPEIEKVVRVGKFDWTKFYVIQDNRFMEERNLVFADSTFFQVFSFPIRVGDPLKVLQAPDRIMLSESMAKKYYGTDNPVGKVLLLRVMNATYNFTIEGVFNDFPEQSHFHANFITSMEFFRKIEGGEMFTSWGANSVHTYLLMKEPEMMQRILARMPGFIDRYVNKDFRKDLHYDLQQLSRIHLYSGETTADIEPQGSITRVILFSSIAMLVLVIAVVNFILLSLALSYQRIKEFGIRKIVGARQWELVSLVSAEFLIVFLLAVQLSLMLVELSIPWLQSRMNFKVNRGAFDNAGILLLFLGIVFILGYLASLYITFSVSRNRPIDALKSAIPVQRRWIPSRGILVIFQFSIMICLLVCLMIIQKQLWLVRNKNLGYRKEQLLTVNIPYNSGNKYQLIKEELLKIPGIQKVSGAAYIPPGNQWWISSMTDPVSGKKMDLEEINGDYDLVETLGIEMVQGRTFSRDFGGDSTAILINETGLRMMGIRNPLESILIRQEQDPVRSKKAIIGVFRDFHIRSLYEKIQPMVIFLSPGTVQQMAVRLAPGDSRATLKQINKKWESVFPDDPIQYVFVDEALHNSYQKEDQAHALITLFTFLSLMIALLGLFGLSAFAVERRTKETGIRKVNGARAADIFYSLSRQFAGWILIAFLIALPVSWYAMHTWLQHFAYRTGISWWVFVLALLLSMLVAGITISWRTYLAAIRNPVDALRYE